MEGEAMLHHQLYAHYGGATRVGGPYRRLGSALTPPSALPVNNDSCEEN